MLTPIELTALRHSGVSEQEYIAAKHVLVAKDSYFSTLNQLTPDEADTFASISSDLLDVDFYLKEKNQNIISRIIERAKSLQLSADPYLTKEEDRMLTNTGLSKEAYLAAKKQSNQ
ncbi:MULTISPECIES: hypothetical protein [Vibrio]|uniref:Uncharacterized protein n=1 Tax=Vibrio cincinnatiensis DSM 19608 TaxID=1123491 RepID=A0A1T4SE72_VIBCI|nr:MULTISPECIES: hypothetical protein [Vibrio]MDA5312295.1 hypothetical protein [Vibrio cholerae]SKA26600.1 hypothetical protein SAMN02745782_03233 [Vibrio cincinnatiensis DSM 19608]SUP05914.1 Uncharacterised protein [Vibrio cincinnatiensis]